MAPAMLLRSAMCRARPVHEQNSEVIRSSAFRPLGEGLLVLIEPHPNTHGGTIPGIPPLSNPPPYSLTSSRKHTHNTILIFSVDFLKYGADLPDFRSQLILHST
jgi:hypothetical protein